jgi:mRNA interferase MazF
MFKKGEIYLARLNPKKGNEVGKIRPVLIYQTNLLNDCEHTTTIIL